MCDVQGSGGASERSVRGQGMDRGQRQQSHYKQTVCHNTVCGRGKLPGDVGSGQSSQKRRAGIRRQLCVFQKHTGTGDYEPVRRHGKRRRGSKGKPEGGGTGGAAFSGRIHTQSHLKTDQYHSFACGGRAASCNH